MNNDEIIKILIFLLLILAFSLNANELTDVERDPAAEQKYAALERSYLWVEKEIQSKKTQIQESSYKKPELIEQISSLEAKLDQLRVRMVEELTGISLNIDIEKPVQPKRDLFVEMQELVGPLLDGLKRVSERPRKVEKLHAQVELLKADQQKYIEAKEIFSNKSLFLTEESKVQLLAWLENRMGQIELEKQTRERELNILMSDKKTMMEQIREIISVFFRTKGKHFALAFIVFLLTTWISFKLKPYFYKLLVRPKTKHLAKFIVALYDLFTVVICLTGFLITLYILDDWMLFTLTLFLIFGMAWSLKNFIPSMLEQVRLILNLGLVKEGERLIFDGLPWRVESIGFQVILINDDLEGARIKIQTKQLIGRYSRVPAKGESWFPTRVGDWIEIADGKMAQVIKQNVDSVTLRYLGNSEIVYPTIQFMNLPFENYRHGLRISIYVGIDYSYQADACGVYLEYFQHKFKQAVESWNESALIRDVQVDFDTAAVNSLNYFISLQCEGALAPKREFLIRLLQKYFVQFCNERQINIPFPQMTLSSRDDFWKNPISHKAN